jgi:BlaI family transcriptional regulator, penicillinase repressor
MSASPQTVLSRRERQIMDIVYRLKQATVQQVLDELPSAPGYSAVRATMRILEEKGFLTHTKQGRQFLYSASIPRETARRSALKRLLSTFFDGSIEDTVSALLNLKRNEITNEEMKRIEEMIKEARTKASSK